MQAEIPTANAELWWQHLNVPHHTAALSELVRHFRSGELIATAFDLAEGRRREVLAMEWDAFKLSFGSKMEDI